MDTNELGLEPLIDVEELAAYLSVPIQTIYGWRCAGTAPQAFKFGKRLKFAVTDVAEWTNCCAPVGHASRSETGSVVPAVGAPRGGLAARGTRTRSAGRCRGNVGCGRRRRDRP
ncbi:AlpA family transcriptional regulator [Nocardioides sp. J9]|uniref:helix-turn-helix transcriptional regulator n=1 Tax=Nocardioides sp. J9 TaxID=935844 RepID=UPI00119D8DB0|nr:helix-turn-helix domain-containing protein [Nocardioides sp. J9]